MKNDKQSKVFFPVLVIATAEGGTWITRLPGMSLTEMYLRAMIRSKNGRRPMRGD